MKTVRDRFGETTPLVTRDVNTHGTEKDIIDILRKFEGQFVLLEANGLLYSSFYNSLEGCRCGSPHVDVFAMGVVAEVEAEGKPLRELTAWELNKDFYDSYYGLREQAIQLYNPMR